MTDLPRPEDVPDRIVAALDRLGRGIRSHRQATATQVDLSPLQLDLLQTISDAPPPEPVTGQLANELGVRQPTVTDSLLALERKGHLVRRRADGHRRRSVFEATATGEALAAEAHSAQAVIRNQVAQLPAGQQDAILESLLALIGTLLDAGIIQVARTCTTCHFYEAPGSADETAYCALLQLPLAPADLRVNCPEHQPAEVPG